MAKLTKRQKALQGKVETTKLYVIDDALALLKECATAKFDESIDVSVQLGVDAKKSDQVVRGAVVMPNGIGKTKRVAVFTQGAKAEADTAIKGVIEVVEPESDEAELAAARAAVTAAFERALQGLIDMRRREGVTLGQILSQRMDDIDARHRELERELVRHVHEMARRIDVVLGEGEKGRVSHEAALRSVRERLRALEERLR